MGPNQTCKLLHSKGSLRKKKKRKEKKRQPTNREKILANNPTNKGLFSKLYKQFM